MRKVCEYVKGNYQRITKIKYFSDSCTVQYKNYKYFLNLCHHYRDFDLEEGWNLFATSHRKSSVGGIGGAIKRLTAIASFQRPYNNHILSADTVYPFCSKTTENILINLIEKDTLNLLWDKIACQYEHGETVHGTRSYHQSCPVSVDGIGYKQVSDDNDLAGTFTFSKAANPKVSFDKISANEYVECYYDSNWRVWLP